MNTRSKTRKRKAQTRISQDIIAVGQVIILRRPGVHQNEPTPSTSASPQKILKQDTDKLNTEQTLTPRCTACKEVPRVTLQNFKVLQCQYGHLLCTDCRPKVASCPICRSTKIDNRSLFVEDFIQKRLQNKPHKCKHEPCNATIKMTGGNLAAHEDFCRFREAGCLNKQCTWVGNLKNYIDHVKNKKCTHSNLEDKVDRENRDNLPIGVEGPYIYKFRNSLMFPNQNPQIFEEINIDMNFKPILLVATGITNFFCYLLIDRNATGTWNLGIYSKLKPQHAKNIKATLLIGDNDTNYSYTTTVLSHLDDQNRVRELGNFMQLNDSQVKRLSNGLKLFDFTLIIKPDPTFSRDAHEKANIGTQFTTPNEPNPCPCNANA